MADLEKRVEGRLDELAQRVKHLSTTAKQPHAWAYAHAIRVDRNDNLWAIDKGWERA